MKWSNPNLRLVLGLGAVALLVCASQAQSQGKGKEPFTDQGNGTFKDDRSGLVWLKDPTPRASPKRSAWPKRRPWWPSSGAATTG